MDEALNYSQYLENKLIDEFKEKFRSKLGYEPIVLTKGSNQKSNNLPTLTLHELETVFTPLLPYKPSGDRYRLNSKIRKRELVELRQIFSDIARKMGYTFKHIGEYLHRDHTTIIHNTCTCRDLIITDNYYRDKYYLIINRIKDTHEPSNLGDSIKTQPESQPDLFSGLLQEQD